jgi:hypothetical protein
LFFKPPGGGGAPARGGARGSAPQSQPATIFTNEQAKTLGFTDDAGGRSALDKLNAVVEYAAKSAQGNSTENEANIRANLENILKSGTNETANFKVLVEKYDLQTVLSKLTAGITTIEEIIESFDFRAADEIKNGNFNSSQGVDIVIKNLKTLGSSGRAAASIIESARNKNIPLDGRFQEPLYKFVLYQDETGLRRLGLGQLEFSQAAKEINDYNSQNAERLAELRAKAPDLSAEDQAELTRLEAEIENYAETLAALETIGKKHNWDDLLKEVGRGREILQEMTKTFQEIKQVCQKAAAQEFEKFTKSNIAIKNVPADLAKMSKENEAKLKDTQRQTNNTLQTKQVEAQKQEKLQESKKTEKMNLRANILKGLTGLVPEWAKTTIAEQRTEAFS